MKTSHPGQVNQWVFCKLRAVIIIFGSVIMAVVMMVIDVDCSQSIRSLERSILGFPRPSAPYFIVRQNSLLDGNTSDILRNASQVNCPTLHYTVSTLQSEVLENAKSCLTWDGKSANGGAKSGEMYCTFSRHGHAIQLKPASAQLGFIFNFVFPSIFCPSCPSPRQHTCQIGAKFKRQWN